MDQVNDALGHGVGRRGLAGEDDAARRRIVGDAVNDGVVVGDDVQHVEQLPLVFVDALDLYVEQRVGVERDVQLAFDVFGQTQLVCPFDGGKVTAELGVVGRRTQRGQAVEMQPPAGIAQPLVE